MNDVGWIGLGKLGFPCAVALADAGVTVHGYDPAQSDAIRMWLSGRQPYPLREQGLQAKLDHGTAQPVYVYDDLAAMLAAVSRRDAVIFFSVQTPHSQQFGGETPVPDVTADFEYGSSVSHASSS
jgi:UDP-N-acetyl-D-mannosaminuronate dehydrogenase